ncbi:MAG: glycosyltransferase family 2 protein [Candidatus Cloacimonadales bacterium]|jgi:glycosyltransferase involved in cell wall biosynthesis|nr:glycosyltransferase family 2 protein [Candidatus Cloacimonadota bacterium]MDY0380858.1 glycosyltransferase family 2 protein [Candidatus Cloacimonadaceae bacterium]MCB5256006.1 glycosyltransferase family 2 protein [Candidatus Cloacimonadota bacterium]MCB5263862.1 glycosyltransferase family 2 protein [Candidatus Cloacimonadota bacterium]MCB5276146.1 glycosyltransferase family 2 protein [Candidatus Cloacimonadota bacterium]
MLLSFVIPVLNEAESLQQLYKEILGNLGEHSYEIIFVDDGSKDGSFGVMTDLAAQDKQVRVIKFRRNFGKAAALQKGFEIACGEVVFTMDADLQDNPAEISAFLEKLNQGYDMVSGWKKKRRDPWHKKLPSRLFNSVTARTFKLKLNDYNCGFKAYRRELVKELYLYGEMHRYIPALANSLGYRIGEIAVQHRARQHGKSKYGLERYLRGFFDLLTVRMVTHYIKSPLYLFGRIGLISTILGSVITLYLTIMKIFWGMPLSNRPLLLMGILLILGGLQFISLGLMSELIINRINPAQRLPLSIETTINVRTETNDEKP